MTRRGVLNASAGVTAFAAAGAVAGTAEAASGRRSDGHPILADRPNLRRADAAQLRIGAAASYLRGGRNPKQQTNGDKGLYRDYRASFTKGLPHNGRGEVDRGAYRQLLKALDAGKNSDFEDVPLAGARKLANPQAAYRFELTGLDSHATFMRPAPTFSGAETSAEMGELYWKALCRDIPFVRWGRDVTIAAAISDLNGFSQTVGPKTNGRVTKRTIFRGETPGDLTGPYLSQFLWKPIPFGNTTIEQKYATPAVGDDFMTTKGDWLAVQRGTAPPPLTKGSPRYISDARALGEFVHVDFTYQAYQSAALILLGVPGAFDNGNLYETSATQGAFVALGGPDVLDLVAKAGNLALTGAWYQK